MSAKKALRELDRRKQVVMARNDLLRQECGAIWATVGRRLAPGRRFGFLRYVPPGAFNAALAAVGVAHRHYARRSRFLGPALSVAGFALQAARPAEEPPPPKRSLGH